MTTSRAVPLEIGASDVEQIPIDWSAWLAAKAEEYGDTVTISSSTWSADSPVTVLSSPAPSVPGGTATVAWVSMGGAVAGRTYALTNTITTTRGHVRTRTFELQVVVR